MDSPGAEHTQHIHWHVMQGRIKGQTRVILLKGIPKTQVMTSGEIQWSRLPRLVQALPALVLAMGDWWGVPIWHGPPYEPFAGNPL